MGEEGLDQLLLLKSLKDPLLKNDIHNSLFPALRSPMSPIENGCFENRNDTWDASHNRLRLLHFFNAPDDYNNHYVAKKQPSKKGVTQLMNSLHRHNSPLTLEEWAIYIEIKLEEARADDNTLSGQRRQDIQYRERNNWLNHRQSAPNYPLKAEKYCEIACFIDDNAREGIG